MIPQPVKNEADILGIFTEQLWAEDGTRWYTKMQSDGIEFTGADTDDLASDSEEIGKLVECWTVDFEPSMQNTREDAESTVSKAADRSPTHASSIEG